MRKFLLVQLVVWVVSLGTNAQGSLTIEVLNIKHQEGYLEIGVFDSEDTFLVKEKASLGIRLKADKEVVSHTFNKLTFGNYAVAIVHDRNNDKKLTKNFLGVPTEAIGFSGNPTLYFGPPDFEDCVFVLDGAKTIQIELR